MNSGPRIVALERLIWSIRTQIRESQGLTGTLGGGGTGPGGPGGGGPGDTHPTTPTGPPGWFGPWGPSSWAGGLGGDLLMQYLRLWNMDVTGWDPYDSDPWDMPVVPDEFPNPPEPPSPPPPPDVTLNLYFSHGFDPAYEGISVTIKDTDTGVVLKTTTTDSSGQVKAPIGDRTEMDVIFTVPAGHYYADDIDVPDPGYGSGDVVTHEGLSTEAYWQFRFYENP